MFLSSIVSCALLVSIITINIQIPYYVKFEVLVTTNAIYQERLNQFICLILIRIKYAWQAEANHCCSGGWWNILLPTSDCLFFQFIRKLSGTLHIYLVYFIWCRELTLNISSRLSKTDLYSPLSTLLLLMLPNQNVFQFVSPRHSAENV